MKRGFTLLELVVVIVILGILAGLALPQYMLAVERSRVAEGILILDAVRQSQMRYYAQWTSYSNDENKLDYTIESPRFFEDPIPQNGTVDNIIATVQREGGTLYGNYTLKIEVDGDIICTGGAGNICTKLGY